MLTGIRIVCALFLLFCPAFSALFYVIYITGGVSDVLDGIAARHFGKETKLGARLDTAADIVFAVVVTVKNVLAADFPKWLIVWIACIAVIKAVSILIGFIKHKRFLCEHTVMNKICGVLLFVIPLCVGRLSRQSVMILIVLTCAAATFAAMQEGHYISIGKEIN